MPFFPSNYLPSPTISMALCVSVSPAQLIPASDVDKDTDTDQPITKPYMIKLNYVDQLMPRLFPIHCMFIFASQQRGTHTHSTCSALRSSLSRVLLLYPSLAGQLVLDKDTQQQHIGIETTNKGVTWIQAHADQQLNEWLPSPEMRAIESDTGYSMDAIPNALLVTSHMVSSSFSCHSSSMLMIQATLFSCGSLVLSVCMQHAAGDGYSYFHFMRNWAQTHRDMITHTTTQTADVVEDRQIITDRIQQWKQQQSGLTTHSYDHTQDVNIHPPCALALLSGSLPPTRCSYHRFSRHTLSTLKAVLVNGVKTLGPALLLALPSLPTYFTTQDALVSHLWSVFNEARGLDHTNDPDAVYRLRINLSCRERFDPALPTGYMGPAALCCPVTVSASLLSPHDTHSLAHFIARATILRQRILQMGRHDYLCSLLDSLSLVPPSHVHEVINNVNGPDTMSTSWTSFPMYDCDFGGEIGKPTLVNKVVPPFARNCFTLMPTPEQDGSIDVIVILETDHHERLVRGRRLYDFDYH